MVSFFLDLCFLLPTIPRDVLNKKAFVMRNYGLSGGRQNFVTFSIPTEPEWVRKTRVKRC